MPRKPKAIDVLSMPNYGYMEAAAFLHLPADTLRYWISPESGPLLIPARKKPPILSFKNLVECYVLDILRRIHKISMPKVRFSVDTLRSLQQARHLMRSAHPLADHDLRIDEKTKRLYIYDLHGKIVQLTAGGQIEWPELVEACLKRVVRDPEGVARSFHPFLARYETLEGSAKDPEYISVNPKVSFGKPVIRGTGITTEIIAGRIIAGDTDLQELAKEYRRPVEEIRAAAQFEHVPIAA